MADLSTARQGPLDFPASAFSTEADPHSAHARESGHPVLGQRTGSPLSPGRAEKSNCPDPTEKCCSAPALSAAAELSIVAPRAKFVLRCRSNAVATAGQAFGVALPETACRAASSGDRAALWLGPDEWLLIAAPEDAPAIAGQLALALGGVPHALVDVSHRSVAITVQGPQAATLINHGCPLDLSAAAFPVGACTRTLFEKAEIVLWRVDEHVYRLEIERSFAAYVWRLLAEAREGLSIKGTIT